MAREVYIERIEYNSLLSVSELEREIYQAIVCKTEEMEEEERWSLVKKVLWEIMEGNGLYRAVVNEGVRNAEEILKNGKV